MTQPQDSSAGATAGAWHDSKPTALLVLADGTVLEGIGFGASGHAVGEVCFNTAMTGYQEILTDPSYAGQIITSRFHTSATSAPTTRTSKRSIWRRRPAHAASSCTRRSPSRRIIARPATLRLG